MDYEYEYVAYEYKYKYFKFVLELYSSSSTEYYISGDNRLRLILILGDSVMFSVHSCIHVIL